MSESFKKDIIHLKNSEMRAIENEYPFAEISEIAELESWRKEVNRPIYHLHKWWAQRLGSVFRSIILAAAMPNGSSIIEDFYQKNNLNGIVVFDPFMGSGTTIGEAIKLGCTTIGWDINPVAYNSVKAVFSQVSRQDLEDTFNKLHRNVGKKIQELYTQKDGSQVLYYFWVKQVSCPKCEADIDLFDNYIFSRHAYPSKNPNAQCYCPHCNEIFQVNYKSTEEICPSCSRKFNPQEAPSRRALVKCHKCSNEFRIVDVTKKREEPLQHKLYAKMVLLPNGEKIYKKITQEDINDYLKVISNFNEENNFIESVFLKPGHNTNQALNHGYKRWDQFFNFRQLLSFSWLAREILKIENPEVRLVFAILFSGTLEFNNMFCSFKGEGTGAVRHMFSHHTLKPERQPLEANIWGTPKSSGSFSTLYKTRLMRMIDYKEKPFELRVSGDKNKKSAIKCFDCNNPIPQDLNIVNNFHDLKPNFVYLACGDSSKTDLGNNSVDLIVTDPPFFDNVQYSELADFFFVWQSKLLEQNNYLDITTRNESEVQDKDAKRFSKKLSDVFKECHRVLKKNGLLIFTYHHSREEGWDSIASAVTSANFHFVSVFPVKSEMSVAVPKNQAKEPINLDIIIVCRKLEDDHRDKIDINEAYDFALSAAKCQINEFKYKNRFLSRTDIKIIIFSNLLVSLSAKRDEKELLNDLKSLYSKTQSIIEEQYLILGNNNIN